ncbi:MAG TPA: acyl-CoA dehydrogenase family protein [Acidimicrobiia bacterium]|nr:acyl-CoA dehydrogenase family protein [Acidimicrobiia bacterium]
MTTTQRTPATTEAVAERVRALAPSIAARAAEIEAARRLPLDLLDDLKRAGCFRLLLPTSHGGIGAGLPDAMRVLEILARADGSTGWTVMIGAGSWCDLTGLPRATFDALYGGDRDVVTAGAFNPSGSIEPVDGGYRVRGRWAFASGCEHADVIYGNCVESIVDGHPQLRAAVFSPDEVTLEDTWNVSGLRGTGSHHFHADVVVPAERTFVPLGGEPCIDDPIIHFPIVSLIGFAVACVATGIAQGALHDIVELATAKVPLLAPGPLAANPRFQYELASADTELRAARAYLYDSAARAWDIACTGGEFTLEDRARLRAASVWATTRAAAVVDFAYGAGGGTSLYAESPLQRRQRDVHAVTQHFIVKPDTLTTAGAILAGQDVDVMVF